jgi:hypothetical protein
MRLARNPPLWLRYQQNRNGVNFDKLYLVGHRSSFRFRGLQQLETGLRAPIASDAASYGALELLPFWHPLRGDPRFEQVVASLAPREANE